MQVEAGEIATILKEKFYTDCGQLDTALAMRDHRVLVDLLLAPHRTRRILRNPLTQVYPAAPIGRPTPSSLESDAGPCEGSSKDLSFDEEDNKWDSSQSWLEIQTERSKRENHLYDASRQTALSLSSTLNYISDRLDCRTGGLSVPGSSSGNESAVPVDSSTRLTVEQPVGVTANEGKMSSPIVSNKDGRNSASKLNKDKVNCPADSLCGADSRLSAEREVDSAAGCSRDVDPCERDKQETLIVDGQALSSLLSVSMGVECITKYQPKQGSTYTFLCAQELRRDEFPHHFHNVHNLIQSNLNGWLEQRCPLAYLGCPFSFRRFRPSTPGMTVCHSWLLESFGLTGQSPEGDASHQTPRYLLPAGPETAQVQSSSTPREGCERSAAEQVVSGSGGTEVFTDAAVACQNPSSALPQGYHVVVESQTESQRHQKSSDKISEVACDTAHAASLSDVDQDRSLKEGSFSALLDSINLDDEESHTRQTLPSTVKTLKYLDTDGHQNDSLESGQGTREQECFTLRVQGSVGCDKHSEESTSKDSGQVPRSPTGSHFSHKAPHFQVSGRHLPNSQASILLAKNPEGKQVIYTGVYANSCVRVDRSVPATPPNSAGAPTGTSSHRMQLTDLPVEILRYITTFLDSFSLCNMALVSRMMRELCSSLLHERGIVSLIWEKRHVGAKVSWQVVGKVGDWESSVIFTLALTCPPVSFSHSQSCPQMSSSHSQSFPQMSSSHSLSCPQTSPSHSLSCPQMSSSHSLSCPQMSSSYSLSCPQLSSSHSQSCPHMSSSHSQSFPQMSSSHSCPQMSPSHSVSCPQMSSSHSVSCPQMSSSHSQSYPQMSSSHSVSCPQMSSSHWLSGRSFIRLISEWLTVLSPNVIFTLTLMAGRGQGWWLRICPPVSSSHLHSPVPQCHFHTHSPVPKCLLHTHSPFPKCHLHTHSPVPKCHLHTHSPVPKCHLHTHCQGGLSSGWSLIREVFHQGGLSSGWSFIREVFHQGGLSSGWSLIREVFHQGSLSSGWSFIRMVFHQGSLSSGRSFIREVFHQAGL